MIWNRTKTTGWALAATAVATAFAAGMLPSAAAAASRDTVREIVAEEAAASPTVPTSLALAVARVESNFDDDALSSAGARGVMQIMPSTAREEFGLAPDRLWDPRTNARVGVAYLEQLYRQYGQKWELALSHYNGGTLNGRSGDAKPHSYTRGYVRDVLAWNGRYQRERTESRVASASGQAEPRGDYWMMDETGVERSWQEYIDIADRWIAVTKGEKPEPSLASTSAHSPAQTDRTAHEGSKSSGTQDRVATRKAHTASNEPDFGTQLEAEARELAKRFRGSLEDGYRTNGLNSGL